MAMVIYEPDYRAFGRRVPDDVAVLGFDDIEYVSADADPPLTTVHQPVVEMGPELVRRLVIQCGGNAADPVIFPTHLVRQPVSGVG